MTNREFIKMTLSVNTGDIEEGFDFSVEEAKHAKKEMKKAKNQTFLNWEYSGYDSIDTFFQECWKTL